MAQMMARTTRDAGRRIAGHRYNAHRPARVGLMAGVVDLEGTT